jgi:histidine triad (HIT) family protein
LNVQPGATRVPVSDQAKLLHEDERCVALSVIKLQAPFHALVIPRRHLVNLNGLSAANEALAGHLLRVTAQVVWHLHLHVLGGRQVGWPPG